jgi:hypothetical protein
MTQTVTKVNLAIPTEFIPQDDASRQAAKGTARGFFAKMTPDPQPGMNELSISGLPDGTRSISVWITELANNSSPHAGAYVFNTQSVQLADNGKGCRVMFELKGGPIAAAAQGIYIHP